MMMMMIGEAAAAQEHPEGPHVVQPVSVVVSYLNAVVSIYCTPPSWYKTGHNLKRI